MDITAQGHHRLNKPEKVAQIIQLDHLHICVLDFSWSKNTRVLCDFYCLPVSCSDAFYTFICLLFYPIAVPKNSTAMEKKSKKFYEQL